MEPIPYTGFLICFGPMAVIIVGFILFAARTDANARRKYLRRTDMRTDKERFRGMQLQSPGAAFTAQTPAGLTVTISPDDGLPAAPTRAASAVAAAPVAEAEPEPEVVVEPDNLRKIEGIGPKMNRILNEAGIETFAQLAAKTADELREILDAGGASKINDPTTWPEQAALAADGDWDGLEKLQGELKGGRR